MARRPRYPVRERNTEFYTRKEIPRLTPASPRQLKHFSQGRKWLDKHGQRVYGKWYDYWAPSPNQSARPAKYKTKKHPNGVHGVVIHTTEGWGSPAETFSKRSRGASSHYGMERDGSVSYLVPENRKAWHTGNSVNDWTIGIEVVGFSVDKGISKGLKSGRQKPMGFPDWQIRSLAKLVAGICRRNNLRPNRRTIFGHRHSGGCGSRESSGRAKPGRPILKGKGGGKGCHYDPGNDFPWNRFMALVKWYYYRRYVVGAAVLSFLGLSGFLAYVLIKKKQKRLTGSVNRHAGVLYFQPGCPYADKVKRKLDSLGLIYELRSTEKQQNRKAVVRLRGDGKATTPILLVDGEPYKGSDYIVSMLSERFGG